MGRPAAGRSGGAGRAGGGVPRRPGAALAGCGPSAADMVAVPSVLLTTATTLVLLAVLAGLAALAAALPGAWLLATAPLPAGHTLERVTFLASALPGVVIGPGPGHRRRCSGPGRSTRPSALLVLAYMILFLPRAIVPWRAGLASAPPELSEAARSLGVGAAGTFARVVLPLVCTVGADRVRPGVPGDHHRAHRDAAAGPDRHPDPGHGVLGGQRRTRLRRRGARTPPS